MLKLERTFVDGGVGNVVALGILKHQHQIGVNMLNTLVFIVLHLVPANKSGHSHMGQRNTVVYVVTKKTRRQNIGCTNYRTVGRVRYINIFCIVLFSFSILIQIQEMRRSNWRLFLAVTSPFPWHMYRHTDMKTDRYQFCHTWSDAGRPADWSAGNNQGSLS